MTRTYKGFTIHKQYVGPCGWNITDESGKVVALGKKSLKDAREWIDYLLDQREILA